MLQVIKEDVVGAEAYYAIYESAGTPGAPRRHVLYVVLTEARGGDVLCYDFDAKDWSRLSRADFETILLRAEAAGCIDKQREERALWDLRFFSAFNGPGDDAALAALLAEWDKKKEAARADYKGWSAKFVHTSFYLNGRYYDITPDMLGIDKSWWAGNGFMEFLQPRLGKDLEALGATEIRHYGQLD